MDGEPAATWRALGLEQACQGEAARPRKSSDLQVALRSHLDDSRTVSEDIATRSTCQLLHRYFHPYPTCELPPPPPPAPHLHGSRCATPHPAYLPSTFQPYGCLLQEVLDHSQVPGFPLPHRDQTLGPLWAGAGEVAVLKDSLGSCQCPVNLFAALPAGPAVGLGNGVSLH